MNVFQNHITKGTFLSVYDETVSNENFHVCRYLSGDGTFVLFQAISTRGYDDGFYLIPLDLIYRVDVDDDYTKRIKKLFILQEQKYYEDISLNDKSLLTRLLRYANQHKLVTSLFMENETDITGWVVNTDFGNGSLCMEKLTENGEKNGIAFVKIEKIEKVICNSGVERCIEMLTKLDNKTGDSPKPLKK